MRKSLLCLGMLIGFLCLGLNPAMGAPPEITGTWTGNASIVFDSNYQSTPMTVEITHQKGARFRGTVTFPAPYGDGTPSPLNGIIFNNHELQITGGKSVTSCGILNSRTAPTRIKGYFNHLEETGSPAHTGTFVLDLTP